MKAEDFMSLVEQTFISEEERKKLIELSKKEKSITKLIELHDALQDNILRTPLSIKLNHIQYIKESMEAGIKYASDTSVDDTVDTNNGQFYLTMPRNIAIMMDKTNGIPERLRDMEKALSGSTEELLTLVAAHKKHPSEKSKEGQTDIPEGFNFLEAKKGGRI